MDGAEFRRVRLLRNRTQEQFAHDLGFVGGYTISNYETGVTAINPRLAALVRAIGAGFDPGPIEQRKLKMRGPRRRPGDPEPLEAAE